MSPSRSEEELDSPFLGGAYTAGCQPTLQYGAAGGQNGIALGLELLCDDLDGYIPRNTPDHRGHRRRTISLQAKHVVSAFRLFRIRMALRKSPTAVGMKRITSPLQMARAMSIFLALEAKAFLSRRIMGVVLDTSEGNFENRRAACPSWCGCRSWITHREYMRGGGLFRATAKVTTCVADSGLIEEGITLEGGVSRSRHLGVFFSGITAGGVGLMGLEFSSQAG